MVDSRCGGIVLGLVASLALTAPAHAQRRPGHRGHGHPPNVPTGAPPVSPTPPVAPTAGAAAVAPIPVARNESLAERVARARSDIERLEFDHALALLTPLHDRADLPPALGVEASILETIALSAEQRAADAINACKRAIVLAGYDPDVAHDQAPRVRAACHTAAEQARHDLVGTRHLGVESTSVTTAPIAWNPVSIQVRFAGDLATLTTQASVNLPNGEVIVVNLPAASGPVRSATLDANLATPGGRIQVTPVVRDAFGTLVQAEQPSTLVVPTAQAAVRFALGSDEGPLRIDGQAMGRLEVGSLVPLEPGTHALEVHASSGVTTTARPTLRRGEIALLTLHGVPGSTFLDVAKYGSTGAAVLLLAGAGIFEVLALQSAAQLTSYSQQRDPVSNQPLIEYSTVMQIDQNISLFRDLALGFLIGGGTFAVLATVFWALPHNSGEAPPARANRAQLGVSPGGLVLRF